MFHLLAALESVPELAFALEPLTGVRLRQIAHQLERISFQCTHPGGMVF